jgi:hypothetical protein
MTQVDARSKPRLGVLEMTISHVGREGAEVAAYDDDRDGKAGGGIPL